MDKAQWGMAEYVSDKRNQSIKGPQWEPFLHNHDMDWSRTDTKSNITVKQSFITISIFQCQIRKHWLLNCRSPNADNWKSWQGRKSTISFLWNRPDGFQFQCIFTKKKKMAGRILSIPTQTNPKPKKIHTKTTYNYSIHFVHCIHRKNLKTNDVGNS